MNKGRVKCFFPSRGYGYIEDNEGREVYFNLSSIDNTMWSSLADGTDVYYEAITTAMGLEALSVQVVA